MADVIGLWISAILTIMITTLAWKDTPVSKTAEHIYLGVITANSIVMAWGNIDSVGIQKIMSGQFLYIIPVILGIMAYARYSKENFWIYRYPIALVVGIGVGAVPGIFNSCPTWMSSALARLFRSTNTSTVVS